MQVRDFGFGDFGECVHQPLVGFYAIELGGAEEGIPSIVTSTNVLNKAVLGALAVNPNQGVT